MCSCMYVGSRNNLHHNLRLRLRLKPTVVWNTIHNVLMRMWGGGGGGGGLGGILLPVSFKLKTTPQGNNMSHKKIATYGVCMSW